MMPDTTPTPAAAAMPAVLSEAIDLLRKDLAVIEPFGDSAGLYVAARPLRVVLDALDAAEEARDHAFDQMASQESRILQQLRAARADLAEFARLLREAQASLLAAILDKETERKRADEWEQSSFRNRENLAACEAALQAERNRRRWAEARASHWRREWYLTMDTLGVRSNDLGRAHMAHRTALAQERQAREQAERDLLSVTTALDLVAQMELPERLAKAEAALADERARGERLAVAVMLLNSMVKSGESHSDESRAIVTAALAAPASPAAEPADQTEGDVMKKQDLIDAVTHGEDQTPDNTNVTFEPPADEEEPDAFFSNEEVHTYDVALTTFARIERPGPLNTEQTLTAEEIDWHADAVLEYGADDKDLTFTHSLTCPCVKEAPTN